MNDKFSRTKLLFGDKFEKLKSSKVLILGVGGVGGFCLDALYRTGIGQIYIVDFDEFEITNQNRQIGSEFLGQKKVKVMKRLYSGVDGDCIRVDKAWVDGFRFDKFDLVIDAIDDLDAKVQVALKTSTNLISSMGAAKRLDTTKIEIADIFKTKSDPFARAFRAKLKQSKFNGHFDVVFSTEEPKCQSLGSFVGVTGAFGLNLASLAIKKLVD